MPLVKVKHITSFSSEEPRYRAENLLSNDTTRKWKCAAGEKSASVVFQLLKSTKISSIDVGNEGSAFIEILVGRSQDESVQYQVILVASSFMSPQESRTGTSPNRVRIFGPDKLVQNIAAQQWDVVKVVCTQPFSKRVPYGLSFIKFHTLEDDDIEQAEPTIAVPKKTENEGPKKTFGSFKLKEEKSTQPALHPGVQAYLYSVAKKENLNIGMWEMKNCRTMEEARKLVDEKQAQKDAKRRSHSPEIKKEIEYKRRKVDQSSVVPPAKSTPLKFSNLKNKNTTPKQTRRDQTTASNSSSKKSTSKSDDPSRASNSSRHMQQRPYNRILDGVIFVLSGFQNPLRGALRDKALGMGAQYRKDWTPDSTHLICAFPNTPKYRQVIGCGGKIVKKEWIEECASRKQLAPWRTYNMNPDQSDSSSEEEEVQAPQMSATRHVGMSSAGGDATAKKQKGESEDGDPYGGSTDEGGDTEDEIERVKTQSAMLQKRNADTEDNEDDIYNASTDEEDDGIENGDVLPSLPNYLADKQFLLYGDFPADTRRLIVRHIVACGGKLLPYMNDEVEFVVTEQEWDSKFDKALTGNAGLVFVRPSWLFQCGSQQRLLPYQPHVVTPL